MKFVYASIFCDHRRMTVCCTDIKPDGTIIDCGHYSCPCGLYWDDGAEGLRNDAEEEYVYLNDPRTWEKETETCPSI